MALTLWKTKIVQIDDTISMKAMFYVEHYFLSHSMQLADALIASTAISQQLPCSLETSNIIEHYEILRSTLSNHNNYVHLDVINVAFNRIIQGFIPVSINSQNRPAPLLAV